MAYAKTFRFVGLETTSRQILRGDRADGVRSVDFDGIGLREESDRSNRRNHRARAARHRFGMELILDAGECAIGIPPDIAEFLRHGIRDGMEQKLDTIVRSRRKERRTSDSRSFETGLGLGCIFYSDLE
jgi:hypothetical protein